MSSHAPDADQLELAATVRAVLAKHSDPAAVRRAVTQPKGYDETLWKLLCEQVGVTALAIPEEYDGAGATVAEVAVVLEELGATLTPSPMLATHLAARALLASGNEAECARLLPRIAAGATATVALDTLVLDGDTADILLAVIDGGLVEVEAAARQHRVSMDQTLRLADVSPRETTAIGAADVQHLEHLGAAAVTALQVGAMQRALDLTVAYSKERVQFGRAIGSFQALKHRMADLYVLLETSRSISWAANQPGADDTTIATAKAWCSDALLQVTGEMVQLHGGIAITWEHDAHLYLKRAHALGQLFGQAHAHRQSLASTL